MGDLFEERVAEVFRRFGLVAFVEPVTGIEPDILVVDRDRGLVIVVEVKWGVSVDTRGVLQICDYVRKLRPLIEALGYRLEGWIVASSCTEYQRKRIEACGATYVPQERLEEMLRSYAK